MPVKAKLISYKKEALEFFLTQGHKEIKITRKIMKYYCCVEFNDR